MPSSARLFSFEAALLQAPRDGPRALVVLRSPVMQSFQTGKLPGILLYMPRVRPHQRARIMLEALGRRAHLVEHPPGRPTGTYLTNCLRSYARTSSSGDCISASKCAISSLPGACDRFSATDASFCSICACVEGAICRCRPIPITPFPLPALFALCALLALLAMLLLS